MNPWQAAAQSYGSDLDQLGQIQQRGMQQSAEMPGNLYQMFMQSYMGSRKQRMAEEEQARQIERDKAMERHRMQQERNEQQRMSELDRRGQQDRRLNFMKEQANFSPTEQEIFSDQYKEFGLKTPGVYDDIKPPETIESPDGALSFDMPQEQVSLDPRYEGGRNWQTNQAKAQNKQETDKAELQYKLARTETERANIGKILLDLQEKRQLLDAGYPQARVDLLKASAERARRPAAASIFNLHTPAKDFDPSVPLDPASESQARYAAQTGVREKYSMRNPGALERNARAEHLASLGGDDIALAGADTKGDVQSLAKAKIQYDQFKIFEQTADKNLKVFENAARGVIDTGSPFLNKPLRAFASAGAGSPEQALFRAANNVVVPEYARINSWSTSGVLSDHAREEAQKMLPLDMTLEQLLAVNNLLRADARNRGEANLNAIEGIRSRIRGRGTSGSTNTQGSLPADMPPKARADYEAGVTVYGPDGKAYTKPRR